MTHHVICIYHADCLDGFAAALAVKTKHPQAQLLPWHYGKPAPVVMARDHVYIVDFSFPMDELVTMCAVVDKVVVYDHHQSAIEKITQSPLPKPANLELHMDLEQSGAGLVWRHLFPEADIPEYVYAVEDRDLWRFARPHTKEICRYLASLDMKVAAWEAIPTDLRTIVNIGKVLLDDDAKRIQWHLEHCLREVKVLGYTVGMVNVPKYLVSETLNEIVDRYPFVVGYHDTAEGRVLRFNSQQGVGMDCAKIAENFGGGGHKHAAGAVVLKSHPLARL